MKKLQWGIELLSIILVISGCAMWTELTTPPQSSDLPLQQGTILLKPGDCIVLPLVTQSGLSEELKAAMVQRFLRKLEHAKIGDIVHVLITPLPKKSPK